MKIGVSTKPIAGRKWYKRLPSLGLDIVEINHRHCYLPFDSTYLEQKKNYLQGFEFSMHSSTRQVLFDSRLFVEADCAIIRAEAELLSRLGGTELIVHFGKGEWTDDRLQAVRDLIEDCKRYGVDLIFESGLNFNGDLSLLRTVPELLYNLDLGHFHLALRRSIIDPDEFLGLIAQRTVYCHAHNNDGESDSHSSLEAGSLDWQAALSKLPCLKKVIIEVGTLEEIRPSLILLQDFFSR